MLQRIDLDDQTGSGSSVQVTEEARRRITEALKQSLAPTTRINHKSQWKRWESFAHENNYPVFPAESVHLADWITQRAADGRKPGTIRMGLAAVGAAHRQANVPNPAEDEGVRATMRGITRAAGRAQKQAAGLTAVSLAAIRATACVPRTGRGGSLETFCNCPVPGGSGHSDGFADERRDAEAFGGCEPDMWRSSRAGRWNGTVNCRSLEDRPGREGAVLFISAVTMDALRAIRPVEVGDADSLFGLSAEQVGRRISSAAAAAGLGEGFTGHSARVGMAQDLARSGTELPALMTAGRWQSPTMPAKYTRAEQAGRGAIARFYGLD